MPPPTVRTRPEPEAAAALATFLERTLDAAATAQPNPGRAPVHRLNRAEYSNAIRDLLAVDVKPGAWLPVDDSGYGFDNIAAVLSTSPALLERYMTAARRISRLAIGDITLKPVEEIYDAKRDPVKGTRNERISDDLPFDSRAGISLQHYFPGRRRIRLQDSHSGSADRGERSRDRSLPGAHPGQGRTALGWRHIAARKPEGRERRAGVAEAAVAGGRGGGGPQIPYPVDLRLNGARVKRFDVPGGTPDVRQLVIGGPYGASGRGTTASRSKIFICDPKSAKEEAGLREDDSDRADAPRVSAPGEGRRRSAAPRVLRESAGLPAERRRAKAISTPAFSARSKRCSSLPISCSASNRIRRSTRRARRTRSAMSSWPRVCRSSSGAAFPTISCSTSPNAAG